MYLIHSGYQTYEVCILFSLFYKVRQSSAEVYWEPGRYAYSPSHRALLILLGQKWSSPPSHRWVGNFCWHIPGKNGVLTHTTLFSPNVGMISVSHKAPVPPETGRQRVDSHHFDSAGWEWKFNSPWDIADTRGGNNEWNTEPHLLPLRWCIWVWGFSFPLVPKVLGFFFFNLV